MDSPEITRIDQLIELFHEAIRPTGQRLLGTESEKFGVFSPGGAPVPYDGDASVMRLFDALVAQHGWTPVRESPEGPIIALARGETAMTHISITLEPGAQLELSGAPLATVHAVEQELRHHLREIAPTSKALGIRWLACGYHPFARQDDLGWVPKQRYAIMRKYFPSVGSRGLDMMRRTATTQVNVDYHSEDDALRKLRLGLKLAPVCTAIFACSPFAEGRNTGRKSERAHVWLDTDADRSGLLPSLWTSLPSEGGNGFLDYVQWALDVPMYLFKRAGQVIANTGQTFRSFMTDGFQGHRATIADWEQHIGTLFPEARMKRTIELRAIDSLPLRFVSAVPALWAGLLYDDRTLASVDTLMARYTHEALEQLRHDAATHGLAATIAGEPVRTLAEQVLQLAQEGLVRRALRDEQGRDESIHLQAISALLEAGRCPADVLVEDLDANAPQLTKQIIDRTDSAVAHVNQPIW